MVDSQSCYGTLWTIVYPEADPQPQPPALAQPFRLPLNPSTILIVGVGLLWLIVIHAVELFGPIFSPSPSPVPSLGSQPPYKPRPLLACRLKHEFRKQVTNDTPAVNQIQTVSGVGTVFDMLTVP